MKPLWAGVLVSASESEPAEPFVLGVFVGHIEGNASSSFADSDYTDSANRALCYTRQSTKYQRIERASLLTLDVSYAECVSYVLDALCAARVATVVAAQGRSVCLRRRERVVAQSWRKPGTYGWSEATEQPRRLTWSAVGCPRSSYCLRVAPVVSC